MPLDVMTLANQVRDMPKLAVDGSAECLVRRCKIQQLIDRHVGDEDHWNDAVVLSEWSVWLQSPLVDDALMALVIMCIDQSTKNIY